MVLDTSRYRVEPGSEVRLADQDPEEEPGDRDDVEKQFEQDVEDIVELHSRLGAEEVDSVLIDMLAFDTGGKDETLNGVFNRLPIQSIQVEKFSEPSKEALAHDFLWRVHIQTPRRGEIVVFNRSYYDDVTEPRVSGEIDLDRCNQRYEHIRNFESLLMDEASTTILKFYFHISRDEQAKRIEERLVDPTRQWDFDPHDIETQRKWDEFETAFEDAINATTTKRAPWYVVPSNKEWVRNAVVARVVVEALERIDPQYPEPPEDLEKWKRELNQIRQSQ